MYQDDQEADVFVISGIGELTPLYENGERITRIKEIYTIKILFIPNSFCKAQQVALPTVVDLQNILLYLSPKKEQEAYWVLNGELRRQEIHRLDQVQDSLVSIIQQGAKAIKY